MLMFSGAKLKKGGLKTAFFVTNMLLE